MIWKVWILLAFIVIFIFTLDSIISDKPNSKFGKWWRKNIINRQDD